MIPAHAEQAIAGQRDATFAQLTGQGCPLAGLIAAFDAERARIDAQRAG